MDKGQFTRFKQYGAAVAIAKHLLRHELITKKEYRKLTEVLSQKYRPAISSPQNCADNLSPVHRTVPLKEKGGF